MKPTKEDFLLTVRKASFRDPGASPIRARRAVNGKTVWDPHVITDPSVRTYAVDSNLLLTDLSFTNAAGLKITTELTEFRDFPVVTLEGKIGNPKSEDYELQRMIAFKHEFCGDFLRLLSCGMTVTTLPCYTMGDTVTLEFDGFTVSLSCPGAICAVYPTPLGIEVYFLTDDSLIPSRGETVLPKVTVSVTEGDACRAETLLAAFRDKHGIREEMPE